MANAFQHFKRLLLLRSFIKNLWKSLRFSCGAVLAAINGSKFMRLVYRVSRTEQNHQIKCIFPTKFEYSCDDNFLFIVVLGNMVICVLGTIFHHVVF